MRQRQRAGLRAVAADDHQPVDAARARGCSRPRARTASSLNSGSRALPRNVPPRCQDAADVAGAERLDLPLDQAGVAVADAEHLPALVEAGADDGADGGVHAGRIAAAGQHSDLPGGHGGQSYSTGGCYAARRGLSTEAPQNRRSAEPDGRRWRKTAPTETNYITPAGFRRLADELTFLRTKKRPEVVGALSDAAAEGDRSENAEYIYRKRQLREIDRRLRFLSQAARRRRRSSTPRRRRAATGSSSAPPSPSRTTRAPRRPTGSSASTRPTARPATSPGSRPVGRALLGQGRGRHRHRRAGRRHARADRRRDQITRRKMTDRRARAAPDEQAAPARSVCPRPRPLTQASYQGSAFSPAWRRSSPGRRDRSRDTRRA